MYRKYIFIIISLKKYSPDTIPLNKFNIYFLRQFPFTLNGPLYSAKYSPKQLNCPVSSFDTMLNCSSPLIIHQALKGTVA